MEINNSEQIMRIMRVVEKYCRETLDVDLMVDSNRIMNQVKFHVSSSKSRKKEYEPEPVLHLLWVGVIGCNLTFCFD